MTDRRGRPTTFFDMVRPDLARRALRNGIAKAIWEATADAYFGGSPTWGRTEWTPENAEPHELEQADEIIRCALEIGRDSEGPAA